MKTGFHGINEPLGITVIEFYTDGKYSTAIWAPEYYTLGEVECNMDIILRNTAFSIEDWEWDVTEGSNSFSHADIPSQETFTYVVELTSIDSPSEEEDSSSSSSSQSEQKKRKTSKDSKEETK